MANATTATVTGSQTTTIGSPPPIAFNVVNSVTSPEGNSALVPLALAPLQAKAQGLAALNATPYTILSLPLTSQGMLSLSGLPVTVGQKLTTQAGQLQFLPTTGFVGNAVFTYQALDNAGLVSNIARYLIPVGADNAAVYASTLLKGGANLYNNNDVIAFVTSTLDLADLAHRYLPRASDRHGGQFHQPEPATEQGIGPRACP